MAPAQVQSYARQLQGRGLTLLRGGQAVDFVAVVDQLRGPTSPVEWLGFARVVYGEAAGKAGICWLRRGPRAAPGLDAPPAPL